MKDSESVEQSNEHWFRQCIDHKVKQGLEMWENIREKGGTERHVGTRQLYAMRSRMTWRTRMMPGP